MAVFDAPRGTGPYDIATTPDGQVFFASLAGNYLGQIDLETGTTTVLEPPVPRQGARRVWSRALDHRLEERRSLPLRQQVEDLGTLAPARRRAAAPRRLCRRDRCSVGQRLGGDCDPALRSEDREIRLIPITRPLCRRAAPGPQGRSLGCRIGCRQALCAEDGVKYASGEYRGAKLRRMKGWSERQFRFCDRVG
jgi:hypothetical protein